MTRKRWTLYDAVAACEGFDGLEHDEETLLDAWQYRLSQRVCVMQLSARDEVTLLRRLSQRVCVMQLSARDEVTLLLALWTRLALAEIHKRQAALNTGG